MAGPFGLATARRGWATSQDVLNTRDLDEIRTWRQTRISRQLGE